MFYELAEHPYVVRVSKTSDGGLHLIVTGEEHDQGIPAEEFHDFFGRSGFTLLAAVCHLWQSGHTIWGWAMSYADALNFIQSCRYWEPMHAILSFFPLIAHPPQNPLFSIGSTLVVVKTFAQKSVFGMAQCICISTHKPRYGMAKQVSIQVQARLQTFSFSLLCHGKHASTHCLNRLSDQL